MVNIRQRKRSQYMPEKSVMEEIEVARAKVTIQVMTKTDMLIYIKFR